MIPKSFNADNIALVTSELRSNGITNKYLLSGILATIGKETGFNLRPEDSYSGTKVARIRVVFGSRVADLNDSDLIKLTKDDYKFFEKVYGYKTKIGQKLGNTKEGDGYKYRGRGFNGLTGKANYLTQQNITGLKLLETPDLLNVPKNASKVLATFYTDTINKGVTSGRLEKSTGLKITDIDTLEKGVRVGVLTTGGFPKNYKNTPILVEGMNKALEYAPDFLDIVQEKFTQSGEMPKDNKKIINLILLGVSLGVLIFVSKKFISLN